MATYDPENPPTEGIPADPLPSEIKEGDSADTDQYDDTRDKVSLLERLRHRKFNNA